MSNVRHIAVFRVYGWFVGYTHLGYRKRSQGLLPGYELGVAGGAIGVDFGADNHCARGGSEDGAA